MPKICENQSSLDKFVWYLFFFYLRSGRALCIYLFCENQSFFLSFNVQLHLQNHWNTVELKIKEKKQKNWASTFQKLYSHFVHLSFSSQLFTMHLKIWQFFTYVPGNMTKNKVPKAPLPILPSIVTSTGNISHSSGRIIL